MQQNLPDSTQWLANTQKILDGKLSEISDEQTKFEYIKSLVKYLVSKL